MSIANREVYSQLRGMSAWLRESYYTRPALNMYSRTLRLPNLGMINSAEDKKIAFSKYV